ncbi:MAG: leucine-rich repeat domain-containing protein, partial [Candidatus Hodarchaeales archaeon]
EYIGNFHFLELLDLSHNQLTSLPASIGNLKTLKILNLDNNQLSSLPDSLSQLNNLEVLKLSSNNFHSLPASLFQLKRLVTLALDENQLEFLSDAISQLTHLRELEAWNNQLSSLPSTLSHLSNLQCLILARNSFSIIPSVIGHLTNLQTLDLTENSALNPCARVYSGFCLQELLTTLKIFPSNLELHELLAGLSIVQRMKDYGFPHVTFEQGYYYYEKTCEEWFIEKGSKESFHRSVEPYKLAHILFEKQEGDYLRFYLEKTPNFSVSFLLENLILRLRSKLQ